MMAKRLLCSSQILAPFCLSLATYKKKTLFWNDNAEQLLSKQENTGLSMHTHVWTLVHTQEAYAQYAHYTLCA